MTADAGTVVAPHDLPPAQYLIMEVLAARWRTGEPTWTFPQRLRPHVTALAAAGLVEWDRGGQPRTLLVWFTDRGRAVATTGTYEPPGWKTQREALARDLDAEAQWLQEQSAKGSDTERREYQLRSSAWGEAARFVRDVPRRRGEGQGT